MNNLSGVKVGDEIYSDSRYGGATVYKVAKLLKQYLETECGKKINYDGNVRGQSGNVWSRSYFRPLTQEAKLMIEKAKAREKLKSSIDKLVNLRNHISKDLSIVEIEDFTEKINEIASEIA